ncbi:hypothetical protein Tco_0850289, partial [Tanacetum coccineum]
MHKIWTENLPGWSQHGGGGGALWRWGAGLGVGGFSGAAGAMAAGREWQRAEQSV